MESRYAVTTYPPPYGQAWKAFYRQGFFDASTGITLPVDLLENATQFRLTAFPPNILAPDLSGDPKLPASGGGRRFLVDPDDQAVVLLSRSTPPSFVDDPHIAVNLEDAVTGLAGDPAKIASGAAVVLPPSPALSIQELPKSVGIIGIVHATDDRGNAASTNPDLDVAIEFADVREGPWSSVAGITFPGGIDLQTAPAGGEDRVTMDVLALPPFGFMRFIVTDRGSDGGDTIFSIMVTKAVLR